MDLHTAKTLIDQYEKEYCAYWHNPEYATHPLFVTNISSEKHLYIGYRNAGWVTNHC